MKTFYPNRRDFIMTVALAGAGALASGPSPVIAKNRGETAMKDLTIALLQIDSNQKDIEGNLKKIIGRVEGAAQEGANLMVSCEMGLSAFLFSRDEYVQVAQTIPGPATEAVGAAAKKANAYVIFGLPEKEGGDIYNSLAVLGPKGNLVSRYRKAHLWLTENQTFSRGNDLCIFETEFGTMGSIICYDIMYPEFTRAIAAKGAGIITHSTGMVTTEDCDKFGWDPEFYNAFVRTRAWENQVYIPSCNRCGNDQFLYFLANSCVATPWGTLAGKLGNAEGTLTVKTDFNRLKEWQKIAPYWDDRRPDLYKKILDF
ncbi:carbon-nitrogen hydrolase family protein [bacterium]|nr:carbon-nitrogen hydrolase family protein [bacterium]